MKWLLQKQDGQSAVVVKADSTTYDEQNIGVFAWGPLSTSEWPPWMHSQSRTASKRAGRAGAARSERVPRARTACARYRMGLRRNLGAT